MVSTVNGTYLINRMQVGGAPAVVPEGLAAHDPRTWRDVIDNNPTVFQTASDSWADAVKQRMYEAGIWVHLNSGGKLLPRVHDPLCPNVRAANDPSYNFDVTACSQYNCYDEDPRGYRYPVKGRNNQVKRLKRKPKTNEDDGSVYETDEEFDIGTQTPRGRAGVFGLGRLMARLDSENNGTCDVPMSRAAYLWLKATCLIAAENTMNWAQDLAKKRKKTAKNASRAAKTRLVKSNTNTNASANAKDALGDTQEPPEPRKKRHINASKPRSKGTRTKRKDKTKGGQKAESKPEAAKGDPAVAESLTATPTATKSEQPHLHGNIVVGIDNTAESDDNNDALLVDDDYADEAIPGSAKSLSGVVRLLNQRGQRTETGGDEADDENPEDEFVKPHPNPKKRIKRKKKKASVVEVNLVALRSKKSTMRKGAGLDMFELSEMNYETVREAADKFIALVNKRDVQYVELPRQKAGMSSEHLMSRGTYDSVGRDDFDLVHGEHKPKRKLKKLLVKNEDKYKQYIKYAKKNQSEKFTPPAERKMTGFDDFVMWLDDEALQYWATLEESSDDSSSAEELVSEIRLELLRQLPNMIHRKNPDATKGPRRQARDTVGTKDARSSEATSAARDPSTLLYLKDNCVVNSMQLRRYVLVPTGRIVVSLPPWLYI